LVVKQLKNLLSFLTVFPVKMDQNMLIDCARNMWAFPLIGALLGLIAGLFSWITYEFLPFIVVGGLALALLLWMTGLHHTDGLLDFGDGIMAHGTPEHKVEVLHDQFTGAGAIGLTLMTYMITAFAFISLVGGNARIGNWFVPLILPALLVVEMSAKLSMVLVAWAGKSVHEGMNSPFLQAMHGSGGNWRLAAALIISFGVAIPLLTWAGALAVLAGIIAGLVMTAVAHRHFNGVTGDVFGATNEIARMVSVVVLLAVVTWA
jgi:adenosylcobinamide-GDP ribazoletransferase